jgi:hypothetical protein
MLPVTANIILALAVLVIWIFFNPQAISKKSVADSPESLSAYLHVNRTQAATIDNNALNKYASLKGQPLFHATRKPAQIEVAPPEPVIDTRIKLQDFQLKGIVYKSNGDNIAYLINRLDNVEHKAIKGDKIEGWSIDDISRTEVRMARDSEQGTLSLMGGTGLKPN